MVDRTHTQADTNTCMEKHVRMLLHIVHRSQLGLNCEPYNPPLNIYVHVHTVCSSRLAKLDAPQAHRNIAHTCMRMLTDTPMLAQTSIQMHGHTVWPID